MTGASGMEPAYAFRGAKTTAAGRLLAGLYDRLVLVVAQRVERRGLDRLVGLDLAGDRERPLADEADDGLVRERAVLQQDRELAGQVARAVGAADEHDAADVALARRALEGERA